MDRTNIDQLCRDGAFDHPTHSFTLRETHISWVILCGEFAYKLKFFQPRATPALL
jgi:aminoglycoside phosphotransferase family enzyme